MLTPELIAEIIGLAGIVLAVTQAVKKWLKLEGYAAVLLSAGFSILCALWRTLSVQPYDWAQFAIMAAGIFLEANGIYQFGAHAVGKAAKQST